jgi:class 3 adenylate cyclase
MEPRIQYARTADGVSIAFWTLGEGAPVVWLQTPPFSHIQLEWQWPIARRTYETLARRRRLVRYDGRGSGLSDRDVATFSLETHLLDLEAVTEKLGLERLALVACGDAGPVAIAYAARHPDKVTHLVLWATYARGGFEEEPDVQGLLALLERDWRLFRETLAHSMLGWSREQRGSWWVEFLAQCTTQAAVREAWLASHGFDVIDLLPSVRAPTLVLHPAPIRWASLEQARLLASQIPDGRLTVLEGPSGALLFDGATVACVDQFLGEGEEPAAEAEPPAAGAVHTILFTDMEGSTALTQRLGDAKARELLRTHEGIVRDALKAHGGSEVKTMGDGFMASFSSATRALECAIAMQRAFAQHNETAEEPIRVRVGLNAGEPIVEEADLFGTAVNLAARIAAKAEGGEVLASDVVRQLVAGKGFLFSDRGDVALRGFEDPVRLYEVRWRESAGGG